MTALLGGSWEAKLKRSVNSVGKLKRSIKSGSKLEAYSLTCVTKLKRSIKSVGKLKRGIRSVSSEPNVSTPHRTSPHSKSILPVTIQRCAKSVSDVWEC